MHTSFFPRWRARLAALGSRVQRLRQQSLFCLEGLFAPFLPPGGLAQAEEGPNSRERVFSVRCTFWGFLWQVLNPNCPCREIVRQIQACFTLQNRGPVASGTGAYCAARKRLPLDTLQRLRVGIAAHIERFGDRWHGWCVKVVDGATISLPDTPANQRAYPQPRAQAPGCGFPLMKVGAVFSLATGVLLDYVRGNKHQHELRLLQKLLDQFRPGDLVLADRGFCCFWLIALLLLRGVGSLMRLHQARSPDLRRGKRLGKNDRLMFWAKPAQKPRYLPLVLWRLLPDVLPVRGLRFNLPLHGFRPTVVTLVTTLVDAKTYPAEAIARLYLRRWQIELWLRDIKTSLGLEVLRCRRPALAHKELEMFFIAYNLIRGVMNHAAVAHAQSLARLSFKGTVDATRQFSVALAQARAKKQRAKLLAQWLEIIAFDEVPDRPGRREPRAVKRRPKPFPLLTAPRHQYQEILHRNDYYLKNKRVQADKNHLLN